MSLGVVGPSPVWRGKVTVPTVIPQQSLRTDLLTQGLFSNTLNFTRVS